MKINVIHKDFGYFSEVPITVQRFEPDWDGDMELVWCNHAGAESETFEKMVPRIDQPDIVWEDSILVCLKCGAFQRSYERTWEDTPVGGLR